MNRFLLIFICLGALVFAACSHQGNTQNSGNNNTELGNDYIDGNVMYAGSSGTVGVRKQVSKRGHYQVTLMLGQSVALGRSKSENGYYEIEPDF